MASNVEAKKRSLSDKTEIRKNHKKQKSILRIKPGSDGSDSDASSDENLLTIESGKSKSNKPIGLEQSIISRSKSIDEKSNEKINSAKHQDASSVVYIGRIPHGFYEEQMRGYFEQFGRIKRLRISRNKATARSKHYGFIEFESPEVAQYVVEATNNYLLFNRLLKCQIIPRSEVHPSLFKGANTKFYALPKHRKIEKELEMANTKSNEVKAKQLKTKINKANKRLELSGIAYRYEA